MAENFWRRENTTLQWGILFLICLFGCGSYFVFDGPAILQKPVQVAMNIDTTEYMGFYKWYSAPGLICCIVSGLLIDNGTNFVKYLNCLLLSHLIIFELILSRTKFTKFECLRTKHRWHSFCISHRTRPLYLHDEYQQR